MKKSFLVVILLSLMLVFFSGPAFASEAKATSALNLSSILNIPGLSVTWSLDSGASFANATATPAYSEYNSAALCATGYCATASVPYTPSPGPYSAKGTSNIVNITPLQLSLLATAKSGPTGSDMPTAIGSAAVSMSYTYTGAGGELTFSLPYSLNLSLMASGVPLTPSTAYGFSSIDFIMTQNGQAIETQEFYMSTLKKNGKFLNFPDAGDLNAGTYDFNVTFRTGDSGTIDFRTYATTSATQPVPIPGAIWLLGTGLVGLVGIRRRQSK